MDVKNLILRKHLSFSCYLRLILLLFLSVNSSTILLAESNQRQQVSGVVRDQLGEPLPGVNILLVGTSTGTITDIDGAYSITVSNTNDAILRFSLIGFSSKDVAVKGRTTVNLTMTEETQIVDEVVVVGYGTQKKVSLTGAISSVKMMRLLLLLQLMSKICCLENCPVFVFNRILVNPEVMIPAWIFVDWVVL